MRFSGYVLATGIYLQTPQGGTRPDVMQVILSNGNKVMVFGDSMDQHGPYVSGDLLNFDTHRIDLDAVQEEGTFYQVTSGQTWRVRDEHTVRSFLLGARILGEARKHGAPGRWLAQLCSLLLRRATNGA